MTFSLKFTIVSKNIRKYYKDYNKNIKNTISTINKFLIGRIIWRRLNKDL